MKHTTINSKHVEVYNECLLKLVKCLQVKATNVFFHHCFQGKFITLPKINNCKYEEKYFNQTQRSCCSI